MTGSRLWIVLLLASLVGGCIKAPDVVIVDRRTALEQQATGRFPTLQAQLDHAGTSAGPTPYTRASLEGAGWLPRKEHDAIAALYRDVHAEHERVDRLLLRRCIGEAKDGTLVETRQDCKGGIDLATVSSLIERSNRNRRQIWRYLLGKRSASSLPSVTQSWRKVHLQAVVCGGWLQRKGGAWVVKKC